MACQGTESLRIRGSSKSEIPQILPISSACVVLTCSLSETYKLPPWPGVSTSSVCTNTIETLPAICCVSAEAVLPGTHPKKN